MRLTTTILLVPALLALAGCSKTTAPPAGPSATLSLKDGSSFAGTVIKSDTSAITVQAPSGESRTYPMTQVASVQYSDQTAPPPVTSAAQAPPPTNLPPPPPANSPEPAPAPVYRPADDFRTIPAGTTLQVRNNSSIDSQTAGPGQTYSAVVAHDVVDTAGQVAIPRGSNATLIVRDVNGQGKVEGRSELVLDVGSVTVQGRTYRLETSDFVEKGAQGVGKNKRTAEFVGGGTALGGIIGAIAGGGKGAAIGALSGAAAGGGTQALTRGHAVRVPAETMLAFRLEAPIRIRELQ